MKCKIATVIMKRSIKKNGLLYRMCVRYSRRKLRKWLREVVKVQPMTRKLPDGFEIEYIGEKEQHSLTST